MTMITPHYFISSYNHTLSSTFSHPTLPFIHHSQNWSCCSNAVSLSTKPNALALSPDESLLAIATGSDVLIYSTQDDMNLAYTLKGHTGWVSEVEWYPGGEKKLVSGSSINGMHQEEVVRFWDLNKEDSSTEVKIDLEYVLQNGWIDNEMITSKLQEPLDSYNGIDLEDVARRATATAAKALIAGAGWTSEEISATGIQLLILNALREAETKHAIIRSCAFPGRLPSFGSSSLSPDGKDLFYLPSRNTVAVLSASTRLEKFRLEGHTDGIMWVGASPDGKLLATSSWDRTVKIWDLQDGSLLRTLKGTNGQNWSGGWSPDGKLIAVGSGDRTVRVWDVLSGNTVHTFGEGGDMFSGWVRGIGFEPSNGHSLIASSWGGTVRVFDLGSGKSTNLYQIDPIASSPLGQRATSFMEISDTLKYAPTSSGRFGFKPTDGRLVVYDNTRNEMWEFVQDKEGGDRIYGPGIFIFSKNGKKVYSGDVDGKVRVWDLD